MATSPLAGCRRFPALVLFASVLFPLAGGCGPSTGTVKGKVTHKGEPLPGGIVMFFPTTGKANPASAQIGEDGRYSIVAPVGEVRISVDNSMLKERDPNKAFGRAAGKIKNPMEIMKKGAAGKAAIGEEKIPGKYVEIDRKYADAENSGLKMTVKPGEQEHNIEVP
jgi:hypothetical protein